MKILCFNYGLILSAFKGAREHDSFKDSDRTERNFQPVRPLNMTLKLWSHLLKALPQF